MTYTRASPYWQFNLLLRGHEYFSFELSTKYTSDGKTPPAECSSNTKGRKKMLLHPYISHAVICIANPTECRISDRAATLNGCARLHDRNSNTLQSVKAQVCLRWQDCNLKLLFLHSDDDLADLHMMDDSEIRTIERHGKNELLCPFKTHAVKREV